MPSVYIGGNGARILHWLANGNFGSHSENNKHLKQVILAASGFDRSDLFNLEITEHHKHEAAFGLVNEGTILIVGQCCVGSFGWRSFYRKWKKIAIGQQFLLLNGLETI